MRFLGKQSNKEVSATMKISRKYIALCVAVFLLVIGAVGSTIAFIVDKDEPVTNTFEPSKVSCMVAENFNQTTGVKKNVRIQNTSDIDTYIRVRLVSYWHDSQGNIIGGAAAYPQGEQLNSKDWVKHGEYYYYKNPVKKDKYTDVLINEFKLEKNQDSETQVLEILAEAIQSKPTAVVEGVWKVVIDADGSITQ